MAEYWQALRSFRPSLRRYLITWVLLSMAAFGLMAVLLNLYLLRLGLEVRFVGLLAGLSQVVWAACALPAGALSSRLGLRNALRLGVVLFGSGLILMLLVELLPVAFWRAWLVAGQGILFAGVAFLTVATPPYLMAITGEQERPHAFAALQVLIPSGALVGSLLAGLLPSLLASQLGLTLEEPAPYRLALWLAPLLVWLSLLPLLPAEPTLQGAQAGEQAGLAPDSTRLPLRLLIWFGGVVWLTATGDGTIRTFFNVYLDRGLGVAPATIGTVMGLAQLLPLAVAFFLPLLLARLGSGYTLLNGTLGLALGLAPLALLPFVGVATLAYVGIMATLTITNAARDLFGQELVAARWRTTSQAVAMVGMALGWAGAGIVGGVLVERFGFGVLFGAGALAALLAVGLLLSYLRTDAPALRSPADTPLV